jgi:hypothetical protein
MFMRNQHSHIPFWRFILESLLLLGAAGIAPGQVPDAGFTYNIVAKLSGKTLDVKGGFSALASFQDTTAIQQWDILGPTQTNQRFRLIRETDGSYTIRAKSSGKCLDVTGGLAARQNGIKIQQYQCNGQANQRWNLVALGGADAGYFEVVSVNSGLVLDVTGGLNATANGDLLQQWQWGNTDNQKFRFTNRGKTVLCVDSLNEGAVNEGEGWERVGLGPVDVVQNGGQLPACLAQVAAGDDLVIVAHGVPATNAIGQVVGGATGFVWGGNTFTGFGNGAGQGANPSPLPPGFDRLTNATVTLKICYAGSAPAAGTPSLVSKMLAAMGGGAGNQVLGYSLEVVTLPVVGFNGPPDLLAGAVAAARATDAWRDNPPTNRPGAAATQQTALQDLVTAAVGAGVMVSIPNARALAGASLLGYSNTFWNVRVPAPAARIEGEQFQPEITMDTAAPACAVGPIGAGGQPCACGQGTAAEVIVPQDVTAQMRLSVTSISPLEQRILVTNTGAGVSAPIYLVFDQLPAAMLTDATGTTEAAAPTGSPYIKIDSNLATGQSTTVKLILSNPNGYGISYTVRFLAGSGSL